MPSLKKLCCHINTADGHKQVSNITIWSSTNTLSPENFFSKILNKMINSVFRELEGGYLLVSKPVSSLSFQNGLSLGKMVVAYFSDDKNI